MTAKVESRRKATHFGSCQCCGSLQKIPAGVLAKHGYTTKFGFFSGTCIGSGEKPFEKSFDLIERCIQNARVKQIDLRAFKADLLARPEAGTSTAWVRVYRDHRAAQGVTGYQWMPVPLAFTTHESTSGGDAHRWITVQYQHPDKKQLQRVDLYGVHSLDPLDFVVALNLKRAQAVEVELEAIADYISWQQKRVDTWKEGTLQEVSK